MKKKVVPKLLQEVKVKDDIVTSDDTKIYYTGKFQDFTARYIINIYIVICKCFHSSPNDKILDWSKLKAFADENFIIAFFFRLQYKPFENNVGKGEIARNKQFLLFSQCFSTCLKNLFSIFVKFEIVVCDLFQFGRV